MGGHVCGASAETGKRGEKRGDSTVRGRPGRPRSSGLGESAGWGFDSVRQYLMGVLDGIPSIFHGAPRRAPPIFDHCPSIFIKSTADGGVANRARRPDRASGLYWQGRPGRPRVPGLGEWPSGGEGAQNIDGRAGGFRFPGPYLMGCHEILMVRHQIPHPIWTGRVAPGGPSCGGDGVATLQGSVT